MKSKGEDIFILFSPHSFLGLCCVIIIIPTLCSVTLCTPPLSSFLGALIYGATNQYWVSAGHRAGPGQDL